MPIPQEILGRRVVGKCVDHLLGRPRGRRSLGDVEMNNLAPFMCDRDQDVKQAKGDRRDHKEIHRRHGPRVVLEKGPPALGWSAPGLEAMLPDGCRRGLQAEFGQFIANAWTAPRGIGLPHPPDELNQLLVLSRPPHAMPRLPAPEDAEPGSLPTDDGLGLEDHQSTFPMGAASLQHDPHQSIRKVELGLVGLARQDRDLVPEGQDLQGEFVLGTEPGQRVAQEHDDDVKQGLLA